MLVHVFRGQGRVFGFTENARGLNLPTQYGPWHTFETLEIGRDGQPTAGVDGHACLNDIENHGFHLTDAHARITDKVA